MKRKILLVNENSFLSTGYANYGRELLSRLVKNQNYEVAELGCLSDGSHPGIKELPWKFFPGVVECPEFHADQTNRWGQFVFSDVCLKFKPHFVIDVRDWWNSEWESRHPARQYFRWGVLANVDSVPQKDDWLPNFCSADAVFTFTQWGTDELRKVLGNNFKSFGPAPHCIAEEFYPRNKEQMRAKFGLPTDSYIVGTIMRNQIRKLYPDLINSFAKFLEKAPYDISSKSYLYIHASYPDAAANFPKLIRDSGVSSRTYFTYHCKNCRNVFSSLFQGVKIQCRLCGARECVLPNSFDGITTETLAELINCLDIYTQYANSEGLGIPQIEAGACGVKVMSTDYSAMSEVVRNVMGEPIPIKRMMYEFMGVDCWRALPDNDKFVDMLISYLIKSKNVKDSNSNKIVQAARKNYNWDNTVAAWSKFFDSVPEESLDRWEKGVTIPAPNLSVPIELSNLDYVNWCVENMGRRKDMVNSFVVRKLANDLDFGTSNRELVANWALDIYYQGVNFEKARQMSNKQ